MADFNIGDAVPLVYTISAAASVVLTVTAPDGTTSTPGLTQGGAPPAVTYTANVPATQAGTWLFRFVATGAVTDAEDGSYFVRAVTAATLYATRHELKSRLTIPLSDTTDDSELEDALASASREIDAHCQRHFWKATATRTFAPDHCYRLRLGAYNDLVSVTTLRTDAGGDGTFETTWAAGDFQLLTGDGTPNTAAAPEPQPYTLIRAVGAQVFPLPTELGRRRDLVEITGVWGWAAVPDAVRQACLLLAAENFKLKDAPFGAVGVAELGIIRIRDNPKAARKLAPYQRYPLLVA